MVTLVAGAVAVGIVSVCAIPLGCFISRKMKKKKVLIPPEVGNRMAFEDEERAPVSASLSNPAEILNEEIWARHNSGRESRFEIRVFVSNGSKRSTDAPSQGYITASGNSQESSSSQRGVSAPAIEARRLSWQHLASGPAAERQNHAGSSSLPIAATIADSRNQRLQDSDTTRFEITISGPFSKSGAQFGEFKYDIPESSTPKARSSCSEKREDRGTDVPRSRFWRRASINRNGPPKILERSRDIEVIFDGDIELPQNSDVEPHLTAEVKEVRNYEGSESRKTWLQKATGSSEVKGKSCDNGRWGLPSRFFETFRETKSFATL